MKYNIKDLKQEASMLGWELLEEKYTNLDTEMRYKCPEGHEISLSYRYWRENKSCPICNTTQYISTNKIVPKTKKKRVLALDDATHTTGWAIFDDNDLIKYGIYQVNFSTEVERISNIKNWLINIVAIWKPDIVIIEDIQLQERENTTGDNCENLTTYKVLAHLQGVLQNILFELKIPFETVYSSVWRKACNIKGKYRADKKKSAQLKVKEWYDINTTNDEADAICLGYYYIKKSTPKIIRWE